jgi:hypothetical protein
MIKEFETEALDYLLGEMEGPRRAAFEQTLMRFPAARAAVYACDELLATLRRQALDVPFFAQIVGVEIGRLLDEPEGKLSTSLDEGASFAGRPMI